MIILTTSTSPQEVKFIARTNDTGSAGIELLDETTGDCSKASVTLYLDRYYTYFSTAFTSLKEGRNYLLIVKVSSVEIAREKIFVTDQSDYSIQNGEYTTRSTTNEYLTYEG